MVRLLQGESLLRIGLQISGRLFFEHLSREIECHNYTNACRQYPSFIPIGVTPANRVSSSNLIILVLKYAGDQQSVPKQQKRKRLEQP